MIKVVSQCTLTTSRQRALVFRYHPFTKHTAAGQESRSQTKNERMGCKGMCKPFHVFHSIAQTLRSRHPYSRTPMTHGAGQKTRGALIIDFYLIEASERRGCTAHRMKGDRAIPFSHTPCDLIVDPARSRKSSNMYTKIFSHRQTHTMTFKRSLSAYCSAEEQNRLSKRSEQQQSKDEG